MKTEQNRTEPNWKTKQINNDEQTQILTMMLRCLKCALSAISARMVFVLFAACFKYAQCLFEISFQSAFYGEEQKETL